MQEIFKKIAKISLVLVYLVIVAGAVVRMTGSGMGCPDWPKCFGHLIPPTSESELLWEPDKSFKKGQHIIRNEALWIAKENLTTGSSYDATQWMPYTRHDYAIFNVYHTWTEFLNRLMGAVAGLATLALALTSITYWRKNRTVTAVSWLVVVAMAFQGWLGATVVFSVLEPLKITFHMVTALLIVGMILYLIHSTAGSSKAVLYDRYTAWLVFAALGITVVQIILGTQVRQFVDGQIDLLGESAANLWLATPNLQFYIHRSFSIGVVLLNLYLGYRIYRLNLGLFKIKWVWAIILLEILTGMAMNYLDFPWGTQALHLILASLLFGIQFYLVLEALKSGQNVKIS